jgi:hypothetical protein
MPLRNKIKEKAKAVVGKILGGQKLSLAAEVGVVSGNTPGSAGAEETGIVETLHPVLQNVEIFVTVVESLGEVQHFSGLGII